MQTHLRTLSLGLALSLGLGQLSAQNGVFKENFATDGMTLKTIGRGDCHVKNGVFSSRESYALFGNPEWKNYSVTFKARAPKGSEQVQIWAGFRAHNRNDRYIVGLKGGLQDDIVLARQGYMGTDEFFAVKPLGFHPIPGEWYKFKIDVVGDRIRVYINDENTPRIDVTDKNSNLAPSGQVSLGGGWLTTEFDDLEIKELPENYFQGIKRQEYKYAMSPAEKEAKRQRERSQYKAIEVGTLNSGRTEISLDGQWLFMPEYQLSDQDKAVNPAVEDKDWHSMSVPNFWNPIRIWLHGETFGSEHYPKGVSDTYFQQETERCENYTFEYGKVKAAWYRQWIELPESIEGKQIELHFDAVSKVADVFINGKEAGSHIGMFGDFSVDATPYLKPGKNLIVVKVVRDFIKNIADADKIVDVAVTVPVTNKMLKDIAHGFYCIDNGGIWQPVQMVITDPVKIEDVFIKPSLTGADYEITLKNYGKKKQSFDINGKIIDKSNNVQLSDVLLQKGVTLNPGEEKIVMASVKGLQPKLWTPQHPNLYNFKFSLSNKKGAIDSKTITSGFRTFEKRDDGFLYLNGKRYWLRGGNHTVFALTPNDRRMADTFYQIMKSGNIETTRTHTTPYNELWITAADENGIGISHEGTWPWLMIQSSMPDQNLIDMWADEYIGMLKKYRNHPSIFFWTINNEMKFYDNDPDKDRAIKKMQIIEKVVKRMREVDPTRPICFDSNYKRPEKRFGKDFFKTFDDGDIDDDHSYINWYDHTVFKQFNGEFQKNKREGRPLISQEMSTGYPNNETGHPTTFYTYVHQNPQVLVGDDAYPYGDPNAFLEAHRFITAELAEALRRSNPEASGILHFALLTWFRNVYDANTIDPYPAYYSMQNSLSPLLVSAELWGRHLYAGSTLPVRFCVVNDLEDGSSVPASTITWSLISAGQVLAKGNVDVPVVEHYGRQWMTANINVPSNLPESRVDAKLKLELKDKGGVLLSQNDYNITLATQEWSNNGELKDKKIVLVDNNNTAKVFDQLQIPYTKVATVAEAVKAKADLYVYAGLDDKNCSAEELSNMRKSVQGGKNALFLNCEKAMLKMYPEHFTGFLVPTEGDIATMEVPESPVFDNIEKMDLRYFNNNKREIPTVCSASMQTVRSEKVVPLAAQMKIHGYINGDMHKRSEYVSTIKGFPLLMIQDQGNVMISTMRTDKAATDPIAGKLLSNMVSTMLK
ncbi:sugar-binding domain-containing protein [Coprobacter fastidiosus]|jgi:beta-galactosidase|uniref:sugar-binding domain-containing protein n=1 Tax=Coprobacter fastidiosus TaxID=1099853 RepID=UPI00241CD83C|nr:sugar-binding domain-containing protein [Coprobacter fastidiosus]